MITSKVPVSTKSSPYGLYNNNTRKYGYTDYSLLKSVWSLITI